MLVVNRIKNISKEVKSAAVYTLATLFSRGLAIITVPIFTRIMTTEEIGTVNIFNSWYALISAIATLSLTSGGFSVGMKDYPVRRKEYISSILSLTSLVALMLGGLYLVNPTGWNRILGLPTELVVLMLIGFLVAPARDFWLAYERYEYRYKLTGVVITLSALVASVGSVFAVVWARKNAVQHIAEIRLYANYIVLFGVAFVVWLYLLLKGKTFYNKEFWKSALSLSLPLVGYQVASQVLNVSDRLMIDSMIGKHEVGIYGTLYTVSSLSLLLWNALNTSFIPYLFQHIENREYRSSIQRTSFSLLVLYSVIAIGLTLMAPEIVRLLGPQEYYEAIYIMPPIAAGVFLTSVAHMYSNILVYYKKTKYVMFASIIAAIANLFLNYYLIPIYGYMAAAYTTLLSYVLLAVFETLWAKKILKEHENESIYNDNKIMIMAIITITVSLLVLFVYEVNVVRYWCIGIVLVVGMVICYKYLRDRKGKK